MNNATAIFSTGHTWGTLVMVGLGVDGVVGVGAGVIPVTVKV